MNFKSTSIKDCIARINQNRLYLPAIQRKLVWDKERIERFFDSAFRGYPIGTFIWWKLSKKIIRTYPFYKFLNNYHERDAKTNEITQRNIFNANSFGILDGQQRLNALYIGLTGTFAYRKKGKTKKNIEKNYITSKLFVNLFCNNTFTNTNFDQYEIRFLNEKEAIVKDKDHYWFEIGKALSWTTDSDVTLFLNRMTKELKNNANISKSYTDAYRRFVKDKIEIKRELNIFRSKINTERLMHYYIVLENNIEKVVNIFQRVNSGGLTLTKADLLFSRLVSEWPNGRKKVEEAISNLSLIGIHVDIEFVMRVCLTLSDLQVLYKEKTFTEENVKVIQSNWESIVSALNKTALLLKGYGFNKHNLKSKNSIIPIAYYIFKGGNIKEIKCKDDFRKYIIVSHLKNIFSGQGDNVLAKIRDKMREKVKVSGGYEYKLRNRRFEYSQLYHIDFTGTKTYRIDYDFIKTKLLTKKIGSDAFLLLTVLYPNIDYEKNLLEVDHIHPKSQFTTKALEKRGYSQSKIRRLQIMKDQIPNLQILEGTMNREKLKTPLAEWLNKIEKKEKGAKKEFIKENFLPQNIEYSFENFEEFYDKRQKSIYRKLKKMLL